jgi:adenylate cyclase
MTLTFQQQLNEELLRSERKRTIIIISIFLFAMVYRFTGVFIFKADAESLPSRSFSAVWLFPVLVIAFELFSLLYINKRIRTNKKKIPVVMQYLNTAFEICLPSLIILSIAKQYPQYDVLKSPALYIYFIFIILSTLRLNFLLSFFCGLLASAFYVSFRLVLEQHFTSNDAGRAVIILLSGVAAGLVANQIKAGINNSVKEAERRQKVENLFGQQLSIEVAEKMLENDGKIESKRMTVAIMFIDIRNFSNFASGRKPEEIVQYQNAFFKIVINTVSAHNGIIHQFLGDGCMVTFGAPLDLENPSQHAVDAANALLSAIEKAVVRQEIPPTKIGLGIHTGEVVTGNIGTNERQQYSITGNVVIMAARIEQLNKQFNSQLLVSEDVIRSINAADRPATCLEAVVLKGWHEPVPIYQLA